MEKYEIVILGAGASGLMCAGNISPKKSVAIIDGNGSVAKKLKISGGGKCNITNAFVGVENFDGERGLLKAVFKKFNKEKLLRFLERNSVELELRKGRYYFCKKSSQVVIDLLVQQASHAKFYLGHKIVSVTRKDELFYIKTDRGSFEAQKVVVATGGKSFEHIGASDVGLAIAKSFGIEVKEFTPALVGLTLQKEQFWMKELSGLSCFVHIKVGQRVLKEEMLFAHKGISGPAVLSASLYWESGEISIDFLPEQNILELTQGKKMLSSSIPLPKRLTKALLKAVGVEDVACYELTKEQNKRLKMLHNYTFAPAGNFGFSKAEVSRGGVVSSGLKSDTLEAKMVPNLHFIGEVVDVTGELGGYNFQWAFSSAYVAAKKL